VLWLLEIILYIISRGGGDREFRVEGDPVVGVLLGDEPLEKRGEELKHYLLLENWQMANLVLLGHLAQAHLKEVVYVVQKNVDLPLGYNTRIRLRIYGVLNPQHQEHKHLLELPPLYSSAELL